MAISSLSPIIALSVKLPFVNHNILARLSYPAMQFNEMEGLKSILNLGHWKCTSFYTVLIGIPSISAVHHNLHPL